MSAGRCLSVLSKALYQSVHSGSQFCQQFSLWCVKQYGEVMCMTSVMEVVWRNKCSSLLLLVGVQWLILGVVPLGFGLNAFVWVSCKPDKRRV